MATYEPSPVVPLSTVTLETDDDAPFSGLFTDLYQLTMAQAYVEAGMGGDSVFTLYFRGLGAVRNFALSCGLDVLGGLSRMRFMEEDLEYLRSLDLFRPRFLDWLADFRFTGDVYAMPEGTPVFPGEPLVEVVAPLPEAQLIETVLMNQVHFQTLIASKAARVVIAAEGRQVVDFGLRRMHGIDAGLKAARAAYVAGVDATSHVLAGRLYGIPVKGTMAHSYVQAYDSEREAFRVFAELYPGTLVIVDTYDTVEGVRRVVELAGCADDPVEIGGVRLDSGDLGRLAFRTRQILDEAGLHDLKIVASGGLDERRIRALVRSGAPIDGFGVGTRMGVSNDQPALDMAFKLAAYDGMGRMKISPGKETVPGRKQVYRRENDDGEMEQDVIGRAGEEIPGRPVLVKMMDDGVLTEAALEPLEAARGRAAEEIARLPAALRSLDRTPDPYPVTLSQELRRYRDEVKEAIGAA